MYISNDGGVTNTYNNTSASIVYFSTFVNFGDGEEFKLSFDRKQLGEQSGSSLYDYSRIYLLDVDAELSNSTLPNAEYAITSSLGKTGTDIAQWVREYFLISGDYANTTKQLVFAWKNDGSGGENPPAAIDNISITVVSCDSPTEISVVSEGSGESAIAEVTVTDANTNTTEYIVEYKLETDYAWNSYASSDNPVVVPDLLYGQRYDLRVLTVCDETDTSFVSDIVSFNTNCSPIAELPYTMSFEETFQPADGIIGNRDIPLCWYNINGGNTSYYWTSSNYQVYDGNKSLYYYGTSYSTSYDFSDWVISPVFELTGGERINFKAMAPYSQNSPVLKVYAKDVSEGDITSMADTSDFTLVETVNLIVSDSFEDYEINLSDYSGNTRFALVVNQISSTFFIDSLTVSAMPDCPEVYGFTVSPASSTSVTVNFNTFNGNGSGWIIAYGQATTAEDFDPEAAEFTANVSEPSDVPYTVEGLVTGETYHFAVKQNCEGEFTTTATVTLPFTVSFPYEQDFEDSENVSEWTFVSTTNNEWIVGSAVNNTDGGSNSLYVTNDGGVTNAYTSPAMYYSENIYASVNIEFGEATSFCCHMIGRLWVITTIILWFIYYLLMQIFLQGIYLFQIIRYLSHDIITCLQHHGKEIQSY